MPSAKSGTTCDLVAPAPPKTALPADEADPGAVEKAKAEQSQTGTGKYGSTAISKSSDGSGADGSAEDSSESQKPTAWISFSLKDDAGKAVANEPYLIKLADGTEQTGSLDDQGKMKLTGITPGSCQICFPRIDKGEWRKL
jgi:hypothetical protein